MNSIVDLPGPPSYLHENFLRIGYNQGNWIEKRDSLTLTRRNLDGAILLHLPSNIRIGLEPPQGRVFSLSFPPVKQTPYSHYFEVSRRLFSTLLHTLHGFARICQVRCHLLAHQFFAACVIVSCGCNPKRLKDNFLGFLLFLTMNTISLTYITLFLTRNTLFLT